MRNVRRKVARSKNVAVLPEIVGTSLDKGREMDALAKLPEAEQRKLAEAAKRGENVSAIVLRGGRDPEDSQVSDGTEEIELGKVIARVRRAQPRNADTMLICNALERRLHRHPPHYAREVVIIFDSPSGGACRGGVPPLTAQQAEELRSQSPEWALVDDARPFPCEPKRSRDCTRTISSWPQRSTGWLSRRTVDTSVARIAC
jgi:hypothetical protein